MREKRGQVFILSVLGIVIVLLSVSSILVSTSLAGLQLPRHQFREDITQISVSARGALASTLADISMRLNTRAELSRYQMNTFLVYTETNSSDLEFTKDSLEFLGKWRNDTVASYPVTGLRLNYSRPEFYCVWNDTMTRVGYSKAAMAYDIDLLGYGFEGFHEYAQAELRGVINEIISTNGSKVVLSVTFTKERAYPIDKMIKSKTILIVENLDRINGTISIFEADIEYMSYVGNGVYIIQYSTEMDTISQNMYLLGEAIQNISITDFEGGQADKDLVLSLVNDSDMLYIGGNYSGSWQILYENLRPKLDHVDENLTLVTAGVDTSTPVRLIDILLSQLQPRIRVVATDERGITVSMQGTLLRLANDLFGPPIVSALAQHETVFMTNPVNVTLTAIADDRGYGSSNIVLMEYVLSDATPTGSEFKYPMTATDGYDSPREEATATVLLSNLHNGTNYIWVRAKDDKGNTGSYTRLRVDKIQSAYLYIANFTMNIVWRKGPADINQYGWIEARIKVVDGGGQPVEGVVVHGVWSGPFSWQGDRVTLSSGWCVFDHPVEKGGKKTYTLTITNMTKTGYTWNETSVSKSLTQ